MGHYHYRAASFDGTILKGFIEADGIDAVRDSIASKGLYVIDIKTAAPLIVKVRRILTPPKINRRDIIEFSNNLSVMLRAGVPLLTALGDIAVTTENKDLYMVITDIKRQTEMGKSFSDAVELSKNVFPDVLVRLVKIGEETGNLEKSLSDVANHLQKMEDLTAAIKRALIYPIFAIVATTGAMIFWLAYVLPKIMDTLRGMDAKLPLITRILVYVSDITKTYWYFVPLVPIAIFLTLQALKRNEVTRYYIDVIKIKFPIVKLVVYNKLLTLFAEQIRILLVAGLTIDRSFDIIAGVMGNEVFKKAIIASKERILSGSRISEALKEHPIFPPFVVRMVDIGETSGNLDEQFDFLAKHYLRKLDDISEKMGKMIEPIVMAVIGILFAVIIIALMLPIYDLISGIGKTR